MRNCRPNRGSRQAFAAAQNPGGKSRLVVVRICLALCCGAPPANGLAQQMKRDDPLANIPETWRVVMDVKASAEQREAIGRKLNASIIQLRNTKISTGNHVIQLNTLESMTEDDARRLRDKLVGIKRDRRTVRQNGTTVYELVAADLRAALEARYALGIQPRRVAYRVTLDAAPLVRCESMDWNRMFNLFLQLQDSEERASDTLAEIDKLRNGFEFGVQLHLRGYGMGPKVTHWQAMTAAKIVETDQRDETVLDCSDAPRRAGVPYLPLQAVITCETYAATPHASGQAERWTAATAHWPAADATWRQLAQEITQGAVNDRERTQAILDWLRPGAHVRYSGGITGSRYGVARVMDQKYGHCWDFSDVFVTLCRASGVPCRQVLGWLYGQSGHVWAEVLLDAGWVQADPTAAMWCGSDYVPLAISQQGPAPLLYLSAVQIEPLPAQAPEAQK